MILCLESPFLSVTSNRLDESLTFFMSWFLISPAFMILLDLPLASIMCFQMAPLLMWFLVVREYGGNDEQIHYQLVTLTVPTSHNGPSIIPAETYFSTEDHQKKKPELHSWPSKQATWRTTTSNTIHGCILAPPPPALLMAGWWARIAGFSVI